MKELHIPVLFFTGGEPLLRDDLCELVQFASKLKLATCIATNGILLSRQLADRLTASGLDLFHLSIDGSCAEIHDKYRGRGTFPESLRGLENAAHTGLPVMVKTMATKHNAHDFENIAELLEDRGTTLWALQSVVPSGRGASLPQSETFSPQELLGLMERIWLLARAYRSKMKIDFNALPFYKVFSYKKAKYNLRKKLDIRSRGGCAMVEGRMLYVNSDGSIRLCSHFPYVLPDVNIRTESIMDIYNTNPMLRDLRNKSNLKGKCKSCKYLFCCGGGCRARVFAETGDFFQEDASCPSLD